MIHVVELAAVLLLLCIGHGVVDVSPHPVRRIARSYVFWVAGLGVVIALFSVPSLVVWLVRLAVVLAAVFAFRWVWGEAVAFRRGPHLVPEPSRGSLRAAFRELSAGSNAMCREAVRTVLREHHPYVALLGLTRLDAAECSDVEEPGLAWRGAADLAIEEVRDAAARLGGEPERSVNTNDMLFLAQALSLYEALSVRQAVAEACKESLRGRRARKRVVDWLARSGRPSEAAKSFLILNGGDAAAERKEEIWTVAGIVWPARGIARAGYPQRAAAYALAFVLLAAYGAFALSIDRGSGWVFLATALFIHIEAVFAIGDFLPAARAVRKGDAR